MDVKAVIRTTDRSKKKSKSQRLKIEATDWLFYINNFKNVRKFFTESRKLEQKLDLNLA